MRKRLIYYALLAAVVLGCAYCCFCTGNDIIELKTTDLSCPDQRHPHAIDLGIGVKWACCNVGSYSPKWQGDYYAWGETKVKREIPWLENYVYFDDYNYNQGKAFNECFISLGYDIARTRFDVVSTVWRSYWHMPTQEQFETLEECCTFDRAILGKTYGMLVTGPNGNKIFLPAHRDTRDCIYWSSTSDFQNPSKAFAFTRSFSGKDGNSWDLHRYCGYLVRPVFE